MLNNVIVYPGKTGLKSMSSCDYRRENARKVVGGFLFRGVYNSFSDSDDSLKKNSRKKKDETLRRYMHRMMYNVLRSSTHRQGANEVERAYL